MGRRSECDIRQVTPNISTGCSYRFDLVNRYDKSYHVVHDWETALGWTSKSILFLFLLKEALLIFAVGIKPYFTKGPHIIDFCITAVAFALEMGFFLSKQYSNNSQAATLTHLITVLLVWRVVRHSTASPSLILPHCSVNSCNQLRLLHGLLETTMAVQNHDAALSEKEQLELMLQKSKTVLNNLEDRVRQLETAVVFQLAAEGRGPRAEARRVWSVDDLQLIQQLFENSHRGILDLNSLGSVPVAKAHSIDQESPPAQEHGSSSQSHATAFIGGNHSLSTFGADYFCTWLTTDSHAKDLHVTYRSQAVECGAALLAHKVIAFVLHRSAIVFRLCRRRLISLCR
jgi:hypothetical protein